MATYDPGNNAVIPPAPTAVQPAVAAAIQPTQFNPGNNPVTAPGADRGPLGEIGTGLARGALVDLPTLVGQAAQFASPTGSTVGNFGQGLVASAAARGQAPGLTLNPALHNGLTNALASGAEQIPSVVAPIAAGLAGVAALPVELPALAGAGIAAAAGGALFGAQAGQQTLEKAQAKGLSPEAAQTASRLNAATTFATQVGLGLAGGHVLGVAGTALSKVVGLDGAPLVGDILGQLTGQNSILAPTLKAAAIGGAEAVGAGAAQSAASAAIEQHYGVDDTSPLAAAADSIGPMLGLTAILTPFGLAGRALQARAAASRTAILAHPDTEPALRSQLADQYQQVLAKSGAPADVAAAQNFRDNAQTAIDNKQALPVDSSLFDAGTIQPPQPTLALPAPMMVGLPNGQVARSQTELNTYINGLPENQQAAARTTLTPDNTLDSRVNVPAPDLAPQPADIAPPAQLANNPTPPGADQLVANSRGLVQKVGNEYRFPDGSSTNDVNVVQQFNDAQEAARQAQPEPARLANNPTPPQVDRMIADSNGLVARDGEAFKFPDGSSTTDIRDVQSYLADRAQADAERATNPNAPKNAADLTADIATANKTITGDDSIKAQQRVPVQRQLDAININALDTHDAQIDALTARLADPAVKIGVPTRDRLTAMLSQWKAERGIEEAPDETIPPEATPTLAGSPPAATDALPTNIGASVDSQAPEQAAAIGENIPAAAPDNAPAPVQAAALGENVTQSAQSHAQDTANMVDATLAGFNDRVRNGEQLAPLEQERMEDLQGMRQSLAEVTSGDNNNDAYAQSISDMARDAATKPYTESYRHYLVDSPTATDPNIMLDAIRTRRLQDTLGTIGEQGSTPEVKALAQRLSALTPDTTIRYGETPEGAEGTVGAYSPSGNHIDIYPGGESEHTILHEATHAAQQAQVARAEAIGIPRSQDEIRLKSAYNEIESIRNEVAQRTGSDAYGLENAHEFLAELNANPEFQQFLKDAGTPGKQSLWTRAVSAVKRLLGLQQGGDYLQRAMAANESFFGKPGPDKAGFPLPRNSPEARLFNKSPAAAAKVTDDQYSKLAGLAGKIAPKLDFTRLNLASYQKMLGFVTKEYMVDRLRAIPEMVKSGFSQAADAHFAADNARRVAVTTIEHPAAAFADRTNKFMNGIKDDDKRRAVGQTMMRIGGESSIHGFDYKLSYSDNVKAGRDLPIEKKAYIDGVHRDYTQLQRTNPDAAKALAEGEQQSARANVMTVATIVRNLIGASGNADLAGHVKQLDFMDPTLKTATNKYPGRFPDGLSSALSDRLSVAFADVRSKLPAGTLLRDQVGEMEGLYRAESQNPYFSLGRQGDYFTKIDFQNMDAAAAAKIEAALNGTNKVLGDITNGQSHAFFRVDTADQAQGLHDKLVQAGGDKVVGGTSAWGKLADKTDSALGVSPALRSILGTLHESVEHAGLSGDAAAALRDTFTRQVLSMLPETSARSAKMVRKGVPGYDGDFLGNFARRASGGVQDLANIHSQPAFTAARKGMDAAIGKLNTSGTADGRVRAQMAADEINLRHTNSQKALDNKAVNLINSLGHTFYLAASPAYLIRTMAQPFHRAAPLLGSRYGMVKASTEIGRAQVTAQKIMANTIAQGYKQGGARGVLDNSMQFRDLGLTPKEEAFVQELHDRGILDLGQARQLQTMAMGGTQLQQDLTRMASMTAQYAEMSGRLATGLAAFRLAERGRDGVAQAGTPANTDYAVKAVNLTMDNFDQTNTARQIGKHGFAGRVTPLLTAFMNYNLQTMQQIARTVHDGLFSQDPSPAGVQRAKEARREFAGLMATTTMISGALGLPFASAFAGVYNTMTNDNNDPQDIRIDAENFLDRTFGHTLGGIVAHGLPHGVGFDSSTFGLENLLPGSEFLASRQLLKDRLDDQSQAMMGPALNAGVGVLNAMDKMSDGFYVKGIEAALPSGLKPYFKAAELATNGYTDSKGNPIGLTATPWDVGLQAVGFQSAKKATQNEAEQFEEARQNRLALAKGLVADKFYKSVTTGDPAQFNAATAALAQYNAANPYQPIRDIGAGLRTRLMSLAVARATGTGVGATAHAVPALEQHLAFARDPNAAMPR